jgi:subtilisin family serine protease
VDLSAHRGSRWGVLGAALALVAVALPAAGAVPTPGPDVTAKIDTAVAAELRADGRADFWVRFADRPDLSVFDDIEDWGKRGRAVYDALRSTAASSQEDVRRELDLAGVDYRSFSITNAIWVEDGDRDLVTELVAEPEVAAILPAADIVLPPAPEGPAADQAAEELPWNLTAINADLVWETGVSGEGIVVGLIDTGVDYTHPALVDHYAGNNGDGSFTHDYHWFDTDGTSPDEPADRSDHGTHVTGIVVGDDGAGTRVGVAPGARWVAANGCCPDNAALVAAAEWMLAPTDLDGRNPRPELRPHIVNNSWSTTAPSTAPFLLDIAEAWAAAGQFAVFANGNSGPACRTAASPGSLQGNYSVGAFGQSGAILGLSGRGPGANGSTKPDIAAPGGPVYSSVPGGGYTTKNGTSMATPHVAGAVALLWSAHPHLVGKVGLTRGLLDRSAVDVENLQCGGTAADNNVFGQGRLDALALLESAPPPGLGTEVTRVSGPDRYRTAIQVSRQFAPGVPVAFVASGQDFPDALAAAARAGVVGGPVLLTRSGAAPGGLLQELVRLDPGQIIVLGGSAAVSQAVLDEIDRATGDVPVTRLGGEDRFSTAVRVAQLYGPVDRVFVASGRDFPDALAGSGRATREGAPVLLVTPDRIPTATARYLAEHAPVSITLLGGDVAVSTAVEEQLTLFGEVRRIAGRNRYETAAALVGDVPDAQAVWVASGAAWPDALAAAARSAVAAEPLLLARRTDVPVTSWLELGRLDPDVVRVAGGPVVVDDAVLEALEALR